MKIVLFSLLFSLCWNLIMMARLRRERKKGESLASIMTGMLTESSGSTQIDDETMRLFVRCKPMHKKALKILVENGVVTDHVEGDNHAYGQIKLKRISA